MTENMYDTVAKRNRKASSGVDKGQKELSSVIEEMVIEQKKLIGMIQELKKVQEELKDEIKIQNFVLNSIPFRSEILN